MVCTDCGTENRPGRRYCLRCGHPLAAACPSCGASNEVEATFCGDCGARLERVAAATAGGPTTASPPARSPVTERRLVTVLFADLVGFTPFAEERDPEAVRELLSAYFELASDVIGRHGGTIEKFIGDAVMAVWGAPIARDDDAERGVRAGLELVAAVGGLGPSIQARVGVLTGEAAVTLASVGQGMVAGDLVNTASRLQSVAQPGAVLVGEATMHAASRSIAFEAAGDQALKGKAAPVPAWRAIRVVAAIGGRGRSLVLEPPFVGRVEELRLLKDLFHATCRDRRPRLVSVTGIGGIGKSRLVWELSKYVDGLADPVLWHTGRSPAYGEGVTFWALGEMVRTRAGLLETDAEAIVRERVAESVQRWIPDEEERRWVEPALLALLGSGQVSAGQRQQLFAAWRTFFERVAADSAVVLVFEDLQWADQGLLDFIDHVHEWSRDVPLLVITLARPELLDRRPSWGAGAREFTSIGLDPLPDEAIGELLGGLVKGLAPAATAAIVERCEGVPLYAVEIVRMLLADGRVVPRGGTLVPAGPLPALGVPETLHELIAARLDALRPGDRTLVADAAVLGQSFTVEALEAVSGSGADELEASLRSLVRHELIAREADPRSPEHGQYAFMQALVREVAYERLARRDRRERHLAVARWYGGLANDELAGALAGQYLAAYRHSAEGAEAEEVAAEARLAISAAAERAAALGSHAQAVDFLEQVLSMTISAGDRARLLERAARSAMFAVEREAAERFIREAVAIHRDLGDRSAGARATAELGSVLMDVDPQGRALPVLESGAVEFADLAGDPGVVELDGQLARALMLSGRAEDAIAISDRTLAAAERLDLVEIVADTLVTRGAALCGVGRRYEGAGVLRAGIALAEANDLASPAQRGFQNLAAYLGDSDTHQAFDAARAATTAAARSGDRGGYIFSLVSAAYVALSAGDWEWARREMDAASDLATGERERAEISLGRIWLSALRGEDVTEEASRLERDLTTGRGGWLDDFMAASLRFGVAFGAGRLREAVQVAMGWPRIGIEGRPLPFAATCALWQRDRDGAAAVLAEMDASGAHGRTVAVDRLTIRAGLAALDGRTGEALAAFRQSLDGWRDQGEPWRLALTAITMATLLGPTEPAVRSAAEEAREVLTRLEARPFLERLDAAMGSRPEPTAVVARH